MAYNCAESNWAAADNDTDALLCLLDILDNIARHRAPALSLNHETLCSCRDKVSCRENVRHDHQGALVNVFGLTPQEAVRQRDAHVLGLAAGQAAHTKDYRLGAARRLPLVAVEAGACR